MLYRTIAILMVQKNSYICGNTNTMLTPDNLRELGWKNVSWDDNDSLFEYGSIWQLQYDSLVNIQDEIGITICRDGIKVNSMDFYIKNKEELKTLMYQLRMEEE